VLHFFSCDPTAHHELNEKTCSVFEDCLTEKKEKGKNNKIIYNFISFKSSDVAMGSARGEKQLSRLQ
jgi:hypothetical protein